MRSSSLWKALLALTGAVALAAALGAAVMYGAAPQQAAADPPARTAGDGRAPAISFVDSPSPTCRVARPNTGACYIGWSYLYVAAAPGASIISMTVTIDGRLRGYHTGFFQPAMYIPGSMTAPGYMVACGKPGSGGAPGMGNSYAYTIRARESTGRSAANHGTVICPADESRTFLPHVRRR